MKHRFQVTRREPEEQEWFGKVLSQVPGLCRWYNIKYDDDEAVYTYKLQDDLKNGDLDIIV